MANTLLGLLRATVGGEDPLTDARSTEIWFDKLPANDYLATSEAMVRALEDMGARQPKITPGRVTAVIELDRLASPIQARLLKQYLQVNLSESIRQRLWHALDDLDRWFAYSYETLFDAMDDFTVIQRNKAQVTAVASRMLFYRGQQAKNALFRYERWTPGKWKGLHAAYEAAVSRGVAQMGFALLDEGLASERSTPEQEYVLILLLHRVNTGNLSAPQIDRAAQWLRKWMPTLSLLPAPQSGDGFWIDLGLGDGLLTRRPPAPQGRVTYLDIQPLQREIGSTLVELTLYTQRTPVGERQSDVAERLALLQRLESLWTPQAKPTPRRGVRIPADRPVQVAPGLTEIAAMLRGAGGDEPLYRPFRQGEPAEAASGAVPPLRIAEPDAIEFEKRGSDAWRVQDASESGLKLVSQTVEAGEQRLGSLLGILDEGQARWKIGVVRRLTKFSGGHAELGVEVIAHHALVISPKPVASRATGYSVDGIDVSVDRKTFDALYLPPSNLSGRAPVRSMLVPAQEFGEKRRVVLTLEGSAYTVEFTSAIERTKEWVWTGFDVVRDAA